MIGSDYPPTVINVNLPTLLSRQYRIHRILVETILILAFNYVAGMHN